MAEDERERNSRRLSPRVEYDDLPHHYMDSDIPHVLARVRVIDVMLELLGGRDTD
jgi:hypothetical protein